MNLQRRLIFANALTVIIPLLITVLCAWTYIYVTGKIDGTEQSLKNTQEITQLTFDLVGSEQSILRRYPERIEDPGFQSQIINRIAAVDGEVAALQGDTVLFSSHNLTKIDVVRLLGSSGWFKQDTITLGSETYSVQPIDLTLATDNKESTILFFLVPFDPASFNLTNFITFCAIIFVLTFIAANVYMSRYFSRGIIFPLNNLRKAAKEITLGNLNHEIVSEGDKELRELCYDLERMRIQLKNSVHNQLKYEDNRKMMITSISHDLKTPVTSIKGYVEGLLDGIANSPEKKEKYLRTIYRKAEQVDTMIDDLLLYAKLDLNQIPFNLQITNIEEFLRDGFREIEPEMERNGIIMHFNSELKEACAIPLDRERMMRVIMNIIDNSRKYMNKEEGRITLSVRETHSSVIIEVQDNGSGIPDLEVRQIFERFYRTDRARSEIKGSGLGLAIAKQIVEGHEGRIWAISRLGEGTSIVISLPNTIRGADS
ncbi:MAG: sensor histidine kinase [Desulfitobacterium sp.]